MKSVDQDFTGFCQIQCFRQTSESDPAQLLGQAVPEIWHCSRIWISVLISDRGRISGAHSGEKGRKRNRLA
jgi:hypothetical protein